MVDTIRGPVTEVIDGDTFDMEVTHVGKSNLKKYKDNEWIRIADIDAPELPSKSGQRAKNDLEKAIGGKQVRCSVQARDNYGRLVCGVSLAWK